MSAIASFPVECSAPGKVILFGEHAVVYGHPSIAVPVSDLRATCALAPAASGTGLTIDAVDIGTIVVLPGAPDSDPLARAARLTLAEIELPVPDAHGTIHSTIPIASGLGSGAAVATALVRALAAFSGRQLEAGTVSRIVFEVEKVHHGTPSGIDNTVVAYEQPVLFQRGQPLERLRLGAPAPLVIGDTGMESSTLRAVTAVRLARGSDLDHFDGLFSRIAEVTWNARAALESGDLPLLGCLLNQNHGLLAAMGVSSEELDRLVTAARDAGALGAKLAGAGQGGNMVALVTPERADAVAAALRAAGAAGVIATTVERWEQSGNAGNRRE